MQLPMISCKLVAISVLSTQLITQAIAAPVNTKQQNSNAIEARGLFHEVGDTVLAHFFPAEAEFKKTHASKKEVEAGAVKGAGEGTVIGAEKETEEGVEEGALKVAVKGVEEGAVKGAGKGAVIGAEKEVEERAGKGAVVGAEKEAEERAGKGAVIGAYKGADEGAVKGAEKEAAGNKSEILEAEED